MNRIVKVNWVDLPSGSIAMVTWNRRRVFCALVAASSVLVAAVFIW